MSRRATWQPRQLDCWLSRLSRRDLLVLEDLERFRLLSTHQVRRLRFTEGHVSALAGTRGAVRVLGRLEALHLIARLVRQVGGSRRGSTATVWQLAATGERLLRARRSEPARRRYLEPSLAFAAHTLAVSELAVRVTEAARVDRFDLLELQVEPSSWRSFTSATGSAAWVKPDLAIVTADQDTETHAWVEVDRGTEHLPAVLRKCALYQRYYATGREQASRGVFPIVLWSVPDEHRAERIEAAIRGDPGLDEQLFIVRPEATVLEQLEATTDADAPKA